MGTWLQVVATGLAVESSRGHRRLLPSAGRSLPPPTSSLPFSWPGRPHAGLPSGVDHGPSLTASRTPSRVLVGIPCEVLCPLTVPSSLPDRCPQVCGQHRARLPLTLAGGRTLQLRPLPEGRLLRAVAREMSRWLGQRPKPGSPTQETPGPRKRQRPPQPGWERSDPQSPASVPEALP